MIRHIFREALGALAHYRLRSCLTMLSIVWGVASLMLLLSYGQGFGAALKKAFQQIGKDLVVVFNGQTSLQAGGERSGRHINLELSDVKAIQEGVPTVEAVSPEVRRWWNCSFGYRSRDYAVSGVYACFERIRSMDIADGRFLSEDDVLHRRRVVVIGDTLRKELFSGLPAVGNEIKINGVRFNVIGVLKKKTQITNYASPDDMTAYVPLTTLSGYTDVRYLSNLVLLPVSNQFRDRIVADVRSALARAHNFNVKDERAVEIVEWNKFLALVENVSAGLKILLGIIGTLTLGIGAIGVVNIMLVSVTERTKEIGLRQAVGAKTGDILSQFLVEAVTLSLAGGTIGIVLGVGASVLISYFASWSTLVSVGSVLLAFLFSALVGVFFGYYPARKAAFLDPIEALRYE